MFTFFIYAGNNGVLTEYEVLCKRNSALQALADFTNVYHKNLIYDVRRHPVDKIQFDSMQHELDMDIKKRIAKGWPID